MVFETIHDFFKGPVLALALVEHLEDLERVTLDYQELFMLLVHVELSILLMRLLSFIYNHRENEFHEAELYRDEYGNEDDGAEGLQFD